MGVPRVSVVMAVRDGERHLREAIDSILRQRFEDFELVIVDDGSRDATPGMLREYEERDRRVRVLGEGEIGLVAALNRACESARGAYLARMDADDVAFPDRLERQVAYLDAHPEIALLGSAYVLIDEAGERGPTLLKPRDHAQIRRSFRRHANPFLHPTIVIRAEVFRRLGGYRSGFPHAEDYDLWLRVAECRETANLAEPLLAYRVHAGQVSHRHLLEGVRSAVAAGVAARVRRETGVEPRWRGGSATPAELSELGLPEARLAQAMIDACFLQANVMLISGHPQAAQALFEEALRRADRSGLRTRLGRVAARRYLEAYAAEGWVQRALAEGTLLATALCARAPIAVQLLREKLGRLPRTLGLEARQKPGPAGARRAHDPRHAGSAPPRL